MPDGTSYGPEITPPMPEAPIETVEQAEGYIKDTTRMLLSTGEKRIGNIIIQYEDHNPDSPYDWDYDGFVLDIDQGEEWISAHTGKGTNSETTSISKTTITNKGKQNESHTTQGTSLIRDIKTGEVVFRQFGGRYESTDEMTEQYEADAKRVFIELTNAMRKQAKTEEIQGPQKVNNNKSKGSGIGSRIKHLLRS